MSRIRQWVRSRFVPGCALIPEDFGKRLTLLKERAGLSWEGMATCIGVDHRQLLRWRKKGAEPSGGPCWPWWRWPNRCLAAWIFSWAGTRRSWPRAGSRDLGRQRWVYRLEPPRFPVEFPQRLERFKVASGLSWRGLARELRIDIRLVKRWRKGARPDSANLIALFKFAAEIGLLDLLLPEVRKQTTD